MKLRWTDRSRRDLIDIGHYIARDKPGAARRWVERLRGTAKQPLAGRRVPEVGRDNVREVLVGNYRIVYEIQKKEIRIPTVFEGHRPLPDSAVRGLDSPGEKSTRG